MKKEGKEKEDAIGIRETPLKPITYQVLQYFCSIILCLSEIELIYPLSSWSSSTQVNFRANYVLYVEENSALISCASGNPRVIQRSWKNLGTIFEIRNILNSKEFLAYSVHIWIKNLLV